MVSILNFFEVILEYIAMLFKSLLAIINFIPEVVAYIHTAFAYVPYFIAPFLMLSLAVTIVFAAIRLL